MGLFQCTRDDMQRKRKEPKALKLFVTLFEFYQKKRIFVRRERERIADISIPKTKKNENTTTRFGCI